MVPGQAWQGAQEGHEGKQVKAGSLVDNDSVILESFPSLVRRSLGLRAGNEPSQASGCLESLNGQEARRLRGYGKEATEPQHSKHGQLLTIPSSSVCLPVHLAHCGSCPKSTSFLSAGSLGSFLPLIMESPALEATRILPGVGITMVWFFQHSGY